MTGADPASIRPTGPGIGRQFWLDVTRGLAVVSMIVAHTSPWGGLWNVSEYLTAPLFAFLVGVSLHLAWVRSAQRYWLFVAAGLLRGLVLVVLGELLQTVYWSIIVVLQTLGVLTIVLAPVVPLLVRRRWTAYAVSATFALLSPVVMGAARDWLRSAASTPETVWLVDVLAAGDAYRVTTFVALGAAGIAVTPWLLGRPTPRPRGAVPSVVLLGCSAGAYLIGRATPIGADAYSGTTPEIVGAVLLCAAVTSGARWLVEALGAERAQRWLGPVAATGRMALTAYTLQILALAAIVRLWSLRSDDNWATMTGVTVLCVAVSWAWLRALPQGPVEALLRLPGQALATSWPTRPEARETR
ncbi:DUF418 domain-containing protein [Intrasporangium sp.]|uniref:DUF418 domain-containing protein n=1 Tax=Intrasporangium sp. TaxID=1925024 RepID=UPI00293B4E99|nr:DUF418 domain-containing protein [Intrasporangium sp.]MDV3222310.1 DUF418 domain-containing protein [Intrasporangium sp.]